MYRDTEDSILKIKEVVQTVNLSLKSGKIKVLITGILVFLSNFKMAEVFLSHSLLSNVETSLQH